MNALNLILIVTLVVLPVVLGIFRTSTEMGISVGAIGLALCFTNLNKFARFKAGGVEAEMKAAVDKAYAAIDELKQLGLSLCSPIVDTLAISGRMLQYIPLKYKLERVEKIAETLKKLGATEREIEEACSTIYERVTSDHVRSILRTLKNSNTDKSSLFEGVDDGKMDDMNSEKIQTLINDKGLKKNAEVEELIQDMDFFLKNKKLRREDQWQS